MEPLALQPPSTSVTPRKRSIDEFKSRSDDSQLPTTPSKGSLQAHHDMDLTTTPSSGILSVLDRSPNAPRSLDGSRQTSPAASANGSMAGNATSTTSTSMPAKRRKLTFAEKQERDLEKQAKEIAKAELKAQKEEEKRQRDEERNKKEEEKLEKKRRKEEERRLKEEAKEDERKKKEEEKKKIEEEKNKRDRSQLRLNSFFTKPKQTAAEPVAATILGAIFGNETRITDNLDLKLDQLVSPEKSDDSEYRRAFPPFFVRSNVSIAPVNRFRESGSTISPTKDIFDQSLTSSSGSDLSFTSSIKKEAALFAALRLSPSDRRRGRKLRFTMKEIVAQIHSSSNLPIDLTMDDDEAAGVSPTAALKQVPLKFLKFAEDVRPPYHGTFTKGPRDGEAKRLSRNPFRQTITTTNYEYDSEAEWEEPDPEDGEDLNSEGDAELGDEDEGDDMADFLDDADANTPNKIRPPIDEDLVPVCSGICWEGPDGKLLQKPKDDIKTIQSPEECRMEIIGLAHSFPIDPYSTEYWESGRSKATATEKSTARAGKRNMDPPRFPLHTITKSSANVNSGSKPATLGDPKAGSNESKPFKVPSRLVNAENIEEFKQAIAGSDLTKAGIVEMLKKRFPKVPKDAIRGTLDLVAERKGTKEVDKRWFLKDGI